MDIFVAGSAWKTTPWTKPSQFTVRPSVVKNPLVVSRPPLVVLGQHCVYFIVLWDERNASEPAYITSSCKKRPKKLFLLISGKARLFLFALHWNPTPYTVKDYVFFIVPTEFNIDQYYIQYCNRHDQFPSISTLWKKLKMRDRENEIFGELQTMMQDVSMNYIQNTISNIYKKYQ